MLRRREFIQRAAIAAAILGVPMARAERVFAQADSENPPLPPQDLYTTDPARYWAELRRQWLLAPDHVNLNCGSVGCTPLPVLRAMIDHILSAEEFREAPYPWFGYEENDRIHALRDSLAGFLNVTRDELAIVRNATEANNVVASGLDMKPGEEVLMSDQEHPGGFCPWEEKAARYGIKINKVTLPKPPSSAEEIVELFEKALTPKTRIIFFSHITTATGVVLPAKEICAMARRRGVLSSVDGAHAIGQIPLDLRDMGCDFYGSSPHKWLMAPKGTGFLYIREEHLKDLWVHTATANWNNYDMKAYRFSWFGTSNLSVMVGLKAAIDFFHQIGPQRIYARAHELATQVRDRVAKYPQAKIVNASSDPFYGGMVCFEANPPLPAGATTGGFKKVVDECAARNMRIAGGIDHFRISTHIFTQPTELDLFYDALDAGLKT
ncbi:MAG TPA: aminotransferase class V-fold PLP-dependent enzyme [Candidatus Acidoferrales bacterium]|nr:aminotransferase class V-fold PLP-dependent enzyme [Candidatus Acidoferrales bacterium]